jgi:hypothetical protein
MPLFSRPGSGFVQWYPDDDVEGDLVRGAVGGVLDVDDPQQGNPVAVGDVADSCPGRMREAVRVTP